MSRLDKQLDEISGEQTVRIHWPGHVDVDVEAIRSALIREIDSHEQRIPLDLRAVDGAPPELVELLHDMRRYAASQSKVLSTSRILPPLRKALEMRARRPIGKSVSASAAPDSELTSDIADDLLRSCSEDKEYDLSTAEVIGRRSDQAKNKPSNAAPLSARYLRMALIVVLITIVIGGVEAYIVFNDEEPVIKVPEKTYESNDIATTD